MCEKTKPGAVPLPVTLRRNSYHYDQLLLLLQAVNDAALPAHSAVRRSKGLSLYKEGLYSQRWSRKYYHCKQRLFNQKEPGPELTGVSVTLIIRKPKPQTQQQKYRATFLLCKYLAESASKETNERFVRCLGTLKTLIKEWEDGHCRCSAAKLLWTTEQC